jgi:ornithine cyclodeaminase/alanine dehydrogenase-like protein (mu-crystallin family)
LTQRPGAVNRHHPDTRSPEIAAHAPVLIDPEALALAASLDATLLTTAGRLRTAAAGIVAVAHPDS